MSSSSASGPGGLSGALDDGGSGSVMAEMMALFAPPGRDSKRGGGAGLNPRPVELHPYYRRPGKGHNHDCCDACGEGGDLICCDHCPASFHFSCHAPPLEEDDLPMGDWMCLRCYVREQSRLGVINASAKLGPTPEETSSISQSAVELPEDAGSAKASKPLRSRSRGTGTGSGVSGTNASGKKQEQGSTSSGSQKAPIKTYKFKYDKYLLAKPNTKSPFDALIAATQVVNAEQFVLPNEMECRESLPFSWKWSDERQDDFDANPKLCFACSKTSRNIPSVGCDFCPNVYHLDCLNPPLSEIPRERWMCPTHPEHVIDSKLVSSTSLTERLRLWQKYARAPVDVDAVRIDFLRKARAGRLFRKSGQRTANPEHRIQVPEFIKEHYRTPLSRRLNHPVDPQGPKRAPDGGEDGDDDDEFLRCLISMQANILQEKGTAIMGEMAETKLKGKKRTAADAAVSSSSSNTAEADDGKRKARKKDKRKTSSGGEEMSTDSDCSVDLDDEEESDPALPPELKEALNRYLSRKLGDRFSQSADEKQQHVALFEGTSSTVRDFLALLKMRELFPEQKKCVSTEEVRSRAALIPVPFGASRKRRASPFLMRHRTVNIGVGAANQLDLSAFGHCNYASARHATLFFDQHAQVYELINYSENGTVVDDTVYALSCRPIASLRNFKSGPEFVMSAKEDGGASFRPCYCETSVARLLKEGTGCEGSAVLHHGSLIRIGCIQFVFSLVWDSEDRLKVEEAPASGNDA